MHMKNLETKYDFCEIAGRSVPEFASGKWKFCSCQLTEVNKHQANILAAYIITFQHHDHHDITDEMMVKLYGKLRGRARTTYEGIQRLCEAGFRSPSPFRVPRPYGYSLEPPVLFIQKVPGIDWREMIFSGDAELAKSSRQAAGWLLKLHNSGFQWWK